jgi:hypothetical protein
MMAQNDLVVVGVDVAKEDQYWMPRETKARALTLSYLQKNNRS